MENTGRYNHNLYAALGATTFRVYVLPTTLLHATAAHRVQRGKSDPADALRIATYLKAHEGELTRWHMEPGAITSLKMLLAERTALVQSAAALQCRIKELRVIAGVDMATQVLELQQAQLKALKQQVRKVEQLIETLLNSNAALQRQATLLRSVEGIGLVVCCKLLCATEGFRIRSKARQLACHAGVVPFEHTSGTSVRGKRRVVPQADKELKRLLYLAALRSIQLKGELWHYYQRKVAEHKSKKLVLVAVANKIIHRACAVIKNNTPYQNRLLMS